MEHLWPLAIACLRWILESPILATGLALYAAIGALIAIVVYRTNEGKSAVLVTAIVMGIIWPWPVIGGIVDDLSERRPVPGRGPGYLRAHHEDERRHREKAEEGLRRAKR